MSVTTTIDPSIASLLIDASIEAYYALDPHAPAKCIHRMSPRPPAMIW